ncbi:DNA polymerase delta subunit 3 [Coniochaeta hoffmannii]|uniref:DNA polymerase delta subunit 3 n=1 Tax=Coniochaeta hoffmannii TaxID=91930 RepID=A0AA38VM47_9PEZI|nr:DNA polymerase delta subunit 3 [Coniochaeta hoffmannii]
MDDYKKFLAENVLSEDKVITYRYLSRALEVHVNTAKQMLYDFHKWQNSKRPGSVHATYLVYGTKKDELANSQPQRSQDEDVDMMSSAPDPEEDDDVVPVKTLSLVAENELQDVLKAYDEVASIHVYSLSPQPVRDMSLLSDAARQVATLSKPEDVVASEQKIYGGITNPNVRRRERRGPGARLAAAPAAVPRAPAPKDAAKPAAKPAAASAKVKHEVKEEKAPTPAPSASASSAASKKSQPSLQRGGSSGLMAAFAKGAAAKAKKAESQPATPSGDDSSVQPLSDDDGEDDSAVLPKPQPQDVAAAKSKAQQRKEELQRMMESDDEEEDVKEKEDTPMEEPEEEKPAAEPEKEEPAEVVSTSGDGRRRGKRKVMKARRFLDEEGNMVTVREPVWEAFSEDEAPSPHAPKAKLASSAPAAKGKKAGPKGQGSIMSFFNKKS